jgi:DNA-binding transcriptional ArsR family regulator
MAEKDERIERLRDEVESLKNQLSKIVDELELQDSNDKSGESDMNEKEEPTISDSDVSLEANDQHHEGEEMGESNKSDEDSEWQWEKRRHRPRYLRGAFLRGDWEDRLGDYIEGFVEDVMEGVSSEVERSLFWDRKPSRERPTFISEDDVKRIVTVTSALGNEHRVKILRELTWGGLYSNELQETLSEISPSTLSSHLDVLQDAGLITQEQRRGRYLITMSGRLAIKMASSIAKRSNIRIE